MGDAMDGPTETDESPASGWVVLLVILVTVAGFGVAIAVAESGALESEMPVRPGLVEDGTGVPGGPADDAAEATPDDANASAGADSGDEPVAHPAGDDGSDDGSDAHDDVPDG